MWPRFVACATFVVLLAGGCGGSGVTNDGATGNLAAPPTGPPASVPRIALPGPSVNVWAPRGVKQALDAVQRAAGGRLLMTQAVLYPEYAIVEARDPVHRANLDRYVFRAGAVDAPSAVMVIGNTDLDAKTFTRGQVAFETVARLVRDAGAQLGIDGARTTHVIVQRDTVFAAGQIVIRVYAGNARRSGYVEYDANGKLRRVVQ